MSGYEKMSNGKRAEKAIQTAWLVLSHGTWISASIGSTAISTGLALIVKEPAFRAIVHPLSFAWSAISLVISVWTLYAIAVTWRTSRSLVSPVFDDFGFIFLSIVTLTVMGGTIWTLVGLAKL